MQTATNVTRVELSVAAITETDNGTDVVLGQSKRFQLCVWTSPGAVTKVAMKLLTPIDTTGVLEATYIGVGSGGRNMPCARSCKAGAVTYEKRWV